MDTELLHQGSIGLNQGEMLRVRDAGGRYIGVVDGAVWITQENDTSDHVLRAGEHFRFDRDGLTLVWPLVDTARLVLEDGLVPERKAASQVISVTRDAWLLARRPYFERRARQMRDEAIGRATGRALAAVTKSLIALWGQISRGFTAASQALLMARGFPAETDSTLNHNENYRDQVRRAVSMASD